MQVPALQSKRDEEATHEQENGGGRVWGAYFLNRAHTGEREDDQRQQRGGGERNGLGHPPHAHQDGYGSDGADGAERVLGFRICTCGALYGLDRIRGEEKEDQYGQTQADEKADELAAPLATRRSGGFVTFGVGSRFVSMRGGHTARSFT